MYIKMKHSSLHTHVTSQILKAVKPSLEKGKLGPKNEIDAGPIGTFDKNKSGIRKLTECSDYSDSDKNFPIQAAECPDQKMPKRSVRLV